jgi:flagellar protein FlbT
MALQLNLRPGERVILGGAVVRNGSSRARLRIENEIPVLRESDILRPGAVRTPCEGVYFALQLAYVDPSRSGEHLETYRDLADQVRAAAPSSRPWLEDVDARLEAGDYYRALKCARALLTWERETLSRVS